MSGRRRFSRVPTFSLQIGAGVAVVIAVAVYANSNAFALEGEGVEHFFKSGAESRSGTAPRTFSFDVKGEEVLFIEKNTGEVTIAAKGPRAARALWNMKHYFNFSRLEIFQALGGNFYDAPAALQRERTSQNLEQNNAGHSLLIDQILETKNSVADIECNHGYSTKNCGPKRVCHSGLLTARVGHVCYGGIALP